MPARKRVQLKFENLDFGAVFFRCKELPNEKDYVQFRDGRDFKSKELAIYCGYYKNRASDVYSTGRYMWVKFSSDHRLGGKGFKAHFEAVELRKLYREDYGSLNSNSLMHHSPPPFQGNLTGISKCISNDRQMQSHPLPPPNIHTALEGDMGVLGIDRAIKTLSVVCLFQEQSSARQYTNSKELIVWYQVILGAVLHLHR